jgi:large subunit ribosomal protein L3
MTRIFNDDGNSIPVSVLKMDNCEVISKKTKETHGYDALQIGYGSKKLKNISKAERGHFSKNNVEPKEKIAEFRVSEDALIDVGKKIGVNHFISGQKVDITGSSKGKGFAGAMKRHNFAGLRASHGVSISHRSHGSTGQCQDPGKVFKGKKMAGQLGNKRITTQNLLIALIDDKEGLILVKGSIPGSKGGLVYIKDSIKAKTNSDLPFPAGFISNDDEVTSIKSGVSVSKENIESNNVSSENKSTEENKKVSGTKELDKSKEDQSL